MKQHHIGTLRVVSSILVSVFVIGISMGCGSANSSPSPTQSSTVSKQSQTTPTPSFSNNDSENHSSSASPSPTSQETSKTPTATPTQEVPQQPTQADSSDQTGSHTYTNARYQYAITIPDSYEWQREADNGDGRKFVNPETSVTIAAYGSHSPAVLGYETPEEFLDWLKSNYNISYSLIQGNVIVASWTEGENIVYERIIIKDGVEYAADFTYPASAQAAGSAAINEVAPTLRILN